MFSLKNWLWKLKIPNFWKASFQSSFKLSKTILKCSFGCKKLLNFTSHTTKIPQLSSHYNISIGISTIALQWHFIQLLSCYCDWLYVKSFKLSINILLHQKFSDKKSYFITSLSKLWCSLFWSWILSASSTASFSCSSRSFVSIWNSRKNIYLFIHKNFSNFLYL